MRELDAILPARRDGPAINPIWVNGIGEIGVTRGAAAAIASAVCHALV